MNSFESKHKVRPKILFISTGATLTGVPVFFISMIKWFKLNSDINFHVLTSGEGPLKYEYDKIAITYRWDGWFEPNKTYFVRLLTRIVRKIINKKERSYKKSIIDKIIKEKFDLIYVNSVSSLPIFNEVNEFFKTDYIIHVHELQISILQFCGIEIMRKNLPQCKNIIAISNAVSENIKRVYNVEETKISVVYTFTDTSRKEKINSIELRKTVREQLDISKDAILVGSSGTLDWRKGADLIVLIAERIKKYNKIDVHFIWIGGKKDSMEYHKLIYDVEKLGFTNFIHFVGEKENPLEYFAAIDMFLLCSREEPVGMVALEAATLGKPIICFDQAGGMPEFVEKDCGIIVPYLDIDKMADAIVLLANNIDLRTQLGNKAEEKVKRHDIHSTCKQIEKIIYSSVPE